MRTRRERPGGRNSCIYENDYNTKIKNIKMIATKPVCIQ
jgi:hypothetical protein